MKVLFTKKNIDKKLISQHFGEQMSYDALDVIRIHHLEMQPFDLKNKSLIFTSINGVESFFKNGFEPNENFTEVNYNKIYCVGQKTKHALRKHGFGTFKVKKHAKDLADFIIQNSQGEKFLHFCGNLALDILDKTLPLQNINYKKVVVYETELTYPSLNTDDFDALVFFSPSGVKSFSKFNSFEGKFLFSIGQTTENELKKHTKNKIYTSTESNMDDLLSLIVRTLSKN